MASDTHSTETVRDLGEFGLIALLEHALPVIVVNGNALQLGIGDDAAIFDVPPGESLVVTSDAMISEIHFRLDWTDWASLGHKLLAVNLSDLAAMGANPIGVVVTLGLTGDELVSELLELYRGLGTLAAHHQVIVAGGDVVRSPGGPMLDLTAFGSVVPGSALRRSGAKVGDLIVVSGTLGAASAGMALLEAGNRNAATAELLIEAHLRPQPRVGLGRILHDHGVTSAMDLSDGLLGDLPKLLASSGVAAEVEATKIPVAAAIRALFPDRWLEFAMRGGEDYELLFTLPEDRVELLKASALQVGSTITVIGKVMDRRPGEIELVNLDGTRTRVAGGAFDHFG